MPIPDSEIHDRIQAMVHEFMDSPANDQAMPTGPEPAYASPLIGFAAGDDPIWDDITTRAAPGHWTPLDAWRLAFPGENARADEISVVAWVLPHTGATKADQRQATLYGCERWVRNYHAKGRVVDGLARFVAGRLGEIGVQAQSPDFLPDWKWLQGGELVISSPWSHRHAAFAAGLGTFGLCDGLITKAGKAMRCGSVVARLKAPPTPREYAGHHDYCLYYSSGLCGKCVKRCPCGALTLAGHDKKKCAEYLNTVASQAVAAAFPDIAGTQSCGLCQSAVPCESFIPRKE